MDPEHQQPKAAKAVRSASEMAREERLKAALMPILARRKAQADVIGVCGSSRTCPTATRCVRAMSSLRCRARPSK